MLALEEYLERRGAKYFVTVLMFCYVLGTIIFNVYLRSLGLYEFDILQLRYMFIGFTFLLFTAVAPALYLFFRGLIKHDQHEKKSSKKRRIDFQNKLEKWVLIFIIPWCILYALFIFPKIPAGFGGARPIEARLIGEADRVQRINDIIARETGVPVERLPYELLNEESDLAMGSNVQILDQSKDRMLLLLTKELYLSSSSRLAKDLIEAGSRVDIDTVETRNFRSKPLPISTEGIETITLSLYEPPEILTKTDIEVAAVALSSSQQKDIDTATAIIAKASPKEASGIIQSVRETVQRANEANPVKSSLSLAFEPDLQTVQQVEDILSSTFDTNWLDIRSQIFNEATRSLGLERRQTSEQVRANLSVFIQTVLFENYPTAYTEVNVSESSYLIGGAKTEPAFTKTIVETIRGAEDVEDFIKRLNGIPYEPPVATEFEPVKEGVLGLFDDSLLLNDSAGNRNYLSEVLELYLKNNASDKKSIWSGSGYLVSGKAQEGYIQKVQKAFQESTTWEELDSMLRNFQNAFLESQKAPAEEPVTETTPEEPVEPEVPSDETPTESTPPTEESVDTTTTPSEETTTESTTPTEETPPAEETTASGSGFGAPAEPTSSEEAPVE